MTTPKYQAGRPPFLTQRLTDELRAGARCPSSALHMQDSVPMGCRLLLARRGDGQVWLLLPVAIELWSHVDIAKISMEFNCAAGLWLSVEKMRESKEMGLKFFFLPQFSSYLWSCSSISVTTP
jgi:hypothetical protein